MKEKLIKINFGLSKFLLTKLDKLAEKKGINRSEALRYLISESK